MDEREAAEEWDREHAARHGEGEPGTAPATAAGTEHEADRGAVREEERGVERDDQGQVVRDERRDASR